ncbi:hypothetical protein [Bauldia litoralis]|uniref:Uncharacterized protein n=1 Tax=Bauldia litoralis TaxID=665467 RepID=A0A1G6D471_9HYPH|nr:hypothetical protein [Bauldia litoralis]SDB39956.1 hypothetical protein SAMN02982931_02991 [Bauldia litoralis]
MTQVHATRQRTDAAVDFDHYRSQARHLRAEALVDFYGTTRSVVFNAIRAPFHRAR